MRRGLFKCDSCEMELHLIVPVERGCPACGGNFVEIKEAGEHPLPKVLQNKMSQEAIDRIVEAAMPEIIEGLELLLAEAANESR